LAGSTDKDLVFKRPIGGLQPGFYFDVSHGLYPDGYGKGERTLKYERNPNAPTRIRSFKLKMMTKSSSDSELVNAKDGSTYVVWTTVLLEDMGFPPKKPIVLLYSFLCR
jgi:hypothetical protein